MHPHPLFDSHAHLTFQQFPPQEREEVLARAARAGVTHLVNVATNEETLSEGIKLAKDSPVKVFLAASTTPHDVIDSSDSFFETVRTAAHSKLVSAIGETGFEFYHHPTKAREQEAVFLRYVALASSLSLPLIVHCREAFTTLISILKNFSLRGVLHCFTGTKEEAKALIDLGWYISFSGIVTYKKSTELREVAAYIPLDRLLVETDSPYLAPQTHRGQRNEPSFLPDTVSTLAEVKSTSFETVAKATFENALLLFEPKEG